MAVFHFHRIVETYFAKDGRWVRLDPWTKRQPLTDEEIIAQAEMTGESLDDLYARYRGVVS